VKPQTQKIKRIIFDKNSLFLEIPQFFSKKVFKKKLTTFFSFGVKF
jgi:hypothetical protein